jgi:hypothetical protein
VSNGSDQQNGTARSKENEAIKHKENDFVREIRELHTTGDGLPPTLSEIEQCVLKDNAFYYAVTVAPYHGIPKGSDVRIVDVQGKQLLVQVRGENMKHFVPAEVIVGKKVEGQVEVPACLGNVQLTDSSAGEVNAIHTHMAAKLGVKHSEKLTEVSAGWKCRLIWEAPDKMWSGEVTATERAKKLARAEAARRMLKSKGLDHPIVYTKVAGSQFGPAKEARRDGPQDKGGSLGGTPEAIASEINTKHNHAVGRLGIDYKEDVTEVDDEFSVILTWNFPDGRRDEVRAKGPTRKIARANAANLMLAKHDSGHTVPTAAAGDKDLVEDLERKMLADLRAGVASLLEVLPTIQRSWGSILPLALQAVPILNIFFV